MKSVLLTLMILVGIRALKLRAWMGPTNFWEGSGLVERYAPGFSALNGNLFIFGGGSVYGEHLLCFRDLSHSLLL